MRLPSFAAVALGPFLALVSASAIFAQQQFADAPVPAQILSAKHIFISNASGESIMPPGTGDLAYNEFYAAMKSWGHYEIVASPGDADLVFEIRFVLALGASINNSMGGDFEFRTVILDPKSHVVLWAFSESVPQAANKTKSRQLFDQAMSTLVNDVKQLTARGGASIQP
jgi:hypothetical protein